MKKHEEIKKNQEDKIKKERRKEADKHGVAFTPKECIEFMNHSVNHLLKEHFNEDLSSKNVEVLDPFTGVGSFIVNLLEKEDLIDDKRIDHQYENNLKANEIMEDSYKIAKSEIEKAYEKRTGKKKEFKGIKNTDTFDE